MSKAIYIAEKPSVAQEFAKALKLTTKRKDGYLEAEQAIVTWCVGHLVTMSYPEKYDEKYRRWSLETLPFLPEKFRYEVIPGAKKQFAVVKELLNREDVDVIYVCTDSGREGEYIYRLVAMQANVKDKVQKRVWIDSQTEEEILRGIQQAKELSAYDTLSDSAFLRAKEDYLMGINFSRVLTLKYGGNIANYLRKKYQPISVGRVMTCVLGIVVKREREIREFVKTPFYKVIAGMKVEDSLLEAEWKVTETSRYKGSPFLYKDNGFTQKQTAEELTRSLVAKEPVQAVVEQVEKKKELKNPPLLFNLAELQNVCAKLFKISPDETLRIVQELYEKKLVTYPRTDARVLSTAISKEIHKNIAGLQRYDLCKEAAVWILQEGSHKNLARSRYVNDKKITDHYAIIPTGQTGSALTSLTSLAANVYEIIARRFLSIFYPPAVYQKTAIAVGIQDEKFFLNDKFLVDEGYLKVATASFASKKEEEAKLSKEVLDSLKKGKILPVEEITIKDGETTPPKRYNSGSIILTMENAGQFIEDEDLRDQIKGSGIGTSATRAEILKKLITIKYIGLNKKTQIITPSLLGEMIYDVVSVSVRSLLNPELTASWEKGLTLVAAGEISTDEYMEKLNAFVRKHTLNVAHTNHQGNLRRQFDLLAPNYKKHTKE
ncbi:MAG: DNA topoisomerase III [Lachnospiraceae bacterium]